MKNIFISSTFKDMQAERDLVQERVLPVLREEARKYGDNMSVIDLRWGVDTSTLETDEGSAKVLSVCLDEIDRSHPYMLIFLGERYGWIPKKDLLEKAVQNRGDKYVADDFEKSVTALEIEYGALSEKYGDLSRCIVCFREPVTAMTDEESRVTYAEQEEKGVQKLRKLKERIKRELGSEDRLISYTCTWDKSARALTDFMVGDEPLEEVLIKLYIEMFQEDWKEYEALSWQEKEQLGFRALMESKLRSFVGREELLEQYYHKIINGTKPIILRGEVGSGKTAVMSKLVERLQDENKKVFSFFSGVGSMSTSADLLVQQMMYYIETELGEAHYAEAEEKSDVEEMKNLSVGKKRKSKYDNLMMRLNEFCSRLQEKVYFCIDALDQLTFDEHVEKLDFLVESKNVQMVLSCTDTFEVTSVTRLRVEEEGVPELSGEDAKKVIRGILRADSRDSYEELERELLKKKSIGNPLYISFLIQRLNMMDQEELAKVNTGKEIAAHSLEVVRSMPETLSDAAVTILKNAVDKVSEADRDELQETVRFLAVSRKGLRIEDLQKIHAARQKEFPVLDFTLLIKYLNTFFYFDEYDRIDFTHKVIRQGMLDGLAERKRYEEEIKGYIKGLDAQDDFRMQEGMYYARITEDCEFARKLAEQAYHLDSEQMLKAIKEEAVSDEGEFYSRLMEEELEENSVVRKLFHWRLLKKFDFSKKEMNTRVRIAEAVLHYAEKLYATQRSIAGLRLLSTSCSCMGNALVDMGRTGEALDYHEKALHYAEERHAAQKNESSLQYLSTDYSNMGSVLQKVGRSKEALTYHEKALHCREKLYAAQKSTTSQKDLTTSYNYIGYTLEELGRSEEALVYYEKALKLREELYAVQKNMSSQQELSLSYSYTGHLLLNMGRLEEALGYYEKVLCFAEERHTVQKNMSSLHNLLVSYSNKGNVLRKMGRLEDTLPYYKKMLEGMEELHAVQKNLSSLRELSNGYSSMGHVLSDLGRFGEALVYYEKSLQLDEEFYTMQKNLSSLRALSVTYNHIGNALRYLGRIGEASVYYEKSMKCNEELHMEQKNLSSLRNLAASYFNVGHVLKDVGRLEEAYTYCEKTLECMEELYAAQKNMAVLQDLTASYDNMGHVLKEMGRFKEALTYYEKALRGMEELHAAQNNLSSLRELSVSYNNIGKALENMRCFKEALEYYEKMLGCMEKLHATQNNLSSLHDLSVSYHNVGYVLLNMEQQESALEYYEKALECDEKLHAEQKSLSSLRSLSIGYANVGNALLNMKRAEDALTYYEKMLNCMEEIHAMQNNLSSLRDLSTSYNNVGHALIDMKRPEDAFTYYEKALQWREELHATQKNRASLKALYASYNYMGDALAAMGRGVEATKYRIKAVELFREL